MIPLLLLLASSVEGTAFDRQTKNGVPGVTVRLAGLTAVSSATGAFRIDDVPEGDHVASFSAPRGFLPPPDAAIHVGPEVARLEAPMIPLAKIGGRVLDPHGRIVPYVNVEAVRVSDATVTSVPAGDGPFSASDLRAGEYRLRAVPTGRSTLPGGANDSGAWRWAPTWFPNALDLDDAATITIREGDDLRGVDIRLRSAPVYRLSGTVEDAAGRPVASALVRLLPDTDWGAAEAESRSGEDGSFEFPAVRAADWHIQAESANTAGFATVPMGHSDFNGARVRLAAPFAVEAVVEGAAREGRPGLMVALRRIDGFRAGPYLAFEDAAGHLRFDSVYPGRYRVELRNAIPGRVPQFPRELDVIPQSPPFRIQLP